VPGARPRRLKFLPLAPLTVVLLGIATALVVAWVGVRQLEAQESSTAEWRARLFSQVMAARVSVTPPEQLPAVLRHGAEHLAAALVVARADGTEVVSAGAPPDRPIAELIRQRSGSLADATRFHASRAGELWVLTFVQPASARSNAASLVGSVAALTWILVGAAALVAFAMARDVHSEVEYVRQRIEQIAREDASPAGEQIAVRSIDQVGMLAAAFNGLVERFTAAERAYRQDLAGAEAYDRDRSAFLAALSHELRTPLNAILGFTEVLLAEVDGPLDDDARENLGVVRSSGGHLRELIDDILELSALESGELVLERRKVDVLGIAEEVVREARVNAQGKPLSIELEGTPTVVFADPRRVRQILGNVLGNAVKFTPAGRVLVSIEPDSASWGLIRVTDTGPGIAPEEQAAIFEEYRQAGDPGMRNAGSGLGLAITRRLVQMHGGTVELESAVGRGSCFSVWLPAEPPERDFPDLTTEASS
jgi:signal transduction histidine kinase